MVHPRDHSCSSLHGYARRTPVLSVRFFLDWSRSAGSAMGPLVGGHANGEAYLRRFCFYAPGRYGSCTSTFRAVCTCLIPESHVAAARPIFCNFTLVCLGALFEIRGSSITMALSSLRMLAGVAALAGTSAFLQPLRLPSTRVMPRQMNALAYSKSDGTRMTVRTSTSVVRLLHRNLVNGWS